MKSSTDSRCSNYIWVIKNFITYLGAPYMRDLTVYIMLQLSYKKLFESCPEVYNPPVSLSLVGLFCHSVRTIRKCHLWWAAMFVEGPSVLMVCPCDLDEHLMLKSPHDTWLELGNMKHCLCDLKTTIGIMDYVEIIFFKSVFFVLHRLMALYCSMPQIDWVKSCKIMHCEKQKKNLIKNQFFLSVNEPDPAFVPHQFISQSVHHVHVEIVCQNNFELHLCISPIQDLVTYHDDVIKWKHFPHYWPFVRGIPRTKASDAEFWCFLWSAPE